MKAIILTVIGILALVWALFGCVSTDCERYKDWPVKPGPCEGMNNAN